jgi:NADH-quinone oxidoreductase subunit K
MIIGFKKIIFLSVLLFVTGVLGIVFNRKNVISTLMAIEIMLLAVNLNFIASSLFLDDIIGQMFALFVITVAAAESAIGLAILIIYARMRGNIEIDNVSLLKG